VASYTPYTHLKVVDSYLKKWNIAYLNAQETPYDKSSYNLDSQMILKVTHSVNVYG